MADIWQAQDAFWNMFDIPAYDDQTIDEGIGYPHMTYESFDGQMGQRTSLSINLWYRSSWAEIKKKAADMCKFFKTRKIVPFDGGYLWFMAPEDGTFAKPFGTGSDDSELKRMLITVEAEVLIS